MHPTPSRSFRVTIGRTGVKTVFMKTVPRRFPVKLVHWAFVAGTIFLASINTRGDGVFVAPKFVWDKHRDINEPTQKAIIAYDSGREDLILQVKYNGPVEE